MANLTKKVIGVDVSSKILVMSLLNDEGKNTIMNVNNQKTTIVKCLKKISPDAYKIVKDIEKLQKRLVKLEDEELEKNKKLLMSISGIGEKTALLLLVSTNNFKNFKSSKALSKYFGVAPRLYHSGNKKLSLGKCRTTKGFVRSVLYVCSWSAIRFNAQCKALYERILESGKAKKLALIAVCNKLLRQSFGVIKGAQTYNPNFIA